jgi:hypothetical protein
MKNKTKHRRTPLKKQYRNLVDQTSIKLKGNGEVERALAGQELLQGIEKEIEAFSAALGLGVMRAVMDHEIESRLGEHGSQSHSGTESKPATWFLVDARQRSSGHGCERSMEKKPI